jgi:1-phosphofructokinase
LASWLANRVKLQGLCQTRRLTLLGGYQNIMTVIAVTFNPAIDHFMSLRRLTPGKDLKVSESRVSAAGKGLNVARVVATLGVPRVALITASNAEASLFRRTEGGKLRVAVFDAGNPVRINTTIYQSADAATTHLRSPSHSLSENVIAEIFARLQMLLNPEAIVVLAGSVPGSTPSSVMSQLVSYAGRRTAAVVLDSSGPGLAGGIRGTPAWVKPSGRELEEFIGRPLRSLEEVVAATETINESGVEHVTVSLGKAGVLATIAGNPGYTRARIPKRHVPVPANPVGAGDAFVGGLAAAVAMRLPYAAILRLGVGAATASQTELDPGSMDGDLARSLADAVELEIELLLIPNGRPPGARAVCNADQYGLSWTMWAGQVG